MKNGRNSQIEAGQVKSPSARVLILLAEAFNVDPDQLFKATGSIHKELQEYYDNALDPEVRNYFGMMDRIRQRKTIAALKAIVTSAPVFSTDLEDQKPLRVSEEGYEK